MAKFLPGMSFLINRSTVKYAALVYGIGFIVTPLVENEMNIAMKIFLFVLGGIFVLAGIILFFEKRLPNNLKRIFEEE